MKEIEVPDPENPKSILDGFNLMGIDTDPDENLALALMNFRKLGTEIKAVVQTARGYVLLVYKEPK